MTRTRLLIVSLVLVAAGAGVTVSVSRSPDDGTTSEDLVARVDRFLAAQPRRLITFEPSPGPKALAERSDVVAIGRIAAFRGGRYFAGSYADDDPSLRMHTAVMELRVERVIAGSLPDPQHRSLYFEFWLDNVTSPVSLDSSAPKEALVLVYAKAIEPDPLYDGLIHDDAAGRPAAQPLMQFTTPQGFLIQAGGLVYRALQPPLAVRGVQLSDLVPPTEVFPPQLQS
jgi:hypothetical protein